MSKTPLPWTIYDTADPLKIGIKGFDRKAGGMHVATVIMPENAELIVKAVNSHDALVKALTDIAAMDPKGIRADDLGRAAHTATDALALVGQMKDR